jgi:hypothetical protein
MEYHSEQSVRLNVGGTIFETKIETLNQSDNYFTRNILNKTNFQHDAKPFFIDRDPELFKYVLDYLRGQSIFLNDDSPLSSTFMQKQLCDEAIFYGITNLEKALNYHIKQNVGSGSAVPILDLWKKLEMTRHEYIKESSKRFPGSRVSYPSDFDIKLHPTNRPRPSKKQVQMQIEMLEDQMREWRIDDKIVETKSFLLQSVKNLQTLAPKSPFTQNLDQHVEQFYRENTDFFRQLADPLMSNTRSKAQEIPELINKFLHFIWAKGLNQTSEDEFKTQTPFDVLFQLISNLTSPPKSEC